MRVCVNWKWIWLHHHYSFICGNINERFPSFLLYSAHHKLRPSNFIHYYYVTRTLTHSPEIPHMAEAGVGVDNAQMATEIVQIQIETQTVQLIYYLHFLGVAFDGCIAGCLCVRSVFNWSPADRRTDFRRIWTHWSIRIALNVSNIFDWNIVCVDFSLRRPFSVGNLRPCVCNHVELFTHVANGWRELVEPIIW